MSLYLLDTSLYIPYINEGLFSHIVERASPNRFESEILSSVVLAELYAGAATKRDRSLVDALRKPAQKRGKIASPGPADWCEAGRMMSRLAEGLPRGERRTRLFNDILIALSARKVGALLYTLNGKDFERIRGLKSFRLQVVMGH